MTAASDQPILPYSFATEDEWTKDVIAHADQVGEKVMTRVRQMMRGRRDDTDPPMDRRKFLGQSALELLGMQLEPFAQLVSDVVKDQYIFSRLLERHPHPATMFTEESLPGDEEHPLYSYLVPAIVRVNDQTERSPVIAAFIEKLDGVCATFFQCHDQFDRVISPEAQQTATFDPVVAILHHAGIFAELEPFVTPAAVTQTGIARSLLLRSVQNNNERLRS